MCGCSAGPIDQRKIAAFARRKPWVQIPLGPLFGLRLRDINFAFKLFRRSLLERIELKSQGSFIDAEFLLRARKAGATIIQIGVDYFPRTRGRSTLSSSRVILGILWDMLRLWREIR